MQKIYYFDTCIWRDYYEDRMGIKGRPLGKYAAKLFMKILKNKDKILFSDSLIWELRKMYNEDEITEILTVLMINKTLIKINITKEEYKEAEKLSDERNLPFIDCLNAIQARNYNAVMITQDKHFFEKLFDVVESLRPDDIN